MATTNLKLTHANPVYGSYFADPFVWKYADTYYAIGTGALEASGQTLGKIFPLLLSNDFLQWKFPSNAMVRPDPALGTHFWAPEIGCHEEKFYLYYSVGREDKNHLHDNKGGSADLHLPLGAGTIELDYYVQRLQAAGYDGTITLEVFTPDKHHLSYSRDVLRRVWDECTAAAPVKRVKAK